MKIHLVAVGTHGDVLPFIALGAELMRRGHTVILAAPAPFAASAARIGLAFHSLGTQAQFDDFVADPQLWRPWRGVRAAFDFFSALTEPTYRWLEGGWTDGIVVASTLSLGARVAQDKLDLPLIVVHVMPMLMESRHAPPMLPGFPLPRFLPPHVRHWLGRGADKFVIQPAALPRLNAFRATIGLPRAGRLRHWWNLTPQLILMFPDWYAPRQPDWPAHAVQVGFPTADHLGDAADLSPALAAFLAAGPKPLVFTYGSGMRQGRPFFETARAICARLRRRGIFLAPQEGQVPPDLGRDVIHVPFAPLSQLLPCCDALVHHGGIGTVALALKAGVPQMIVPLAFNHFDEARRVTELGVGASLSRRRFTPARGARRLTRLLSDPDVKQACRNLRNHALDGDGVKEACDVIERSMLKSTLVV
ncbi:glycosyltransferase [uncultured Methylobacterium sp.]|uniref:glycosyltransferase n=1 Tax=uncultured Methylobacterium sp. TaxID=157278 RepID=UPI0035CC3986